MALSNQRRWECHETMIRQRKVKICFLKVIVYGCVHWAVEESAVLQKLIDSWRLYRKDIHPFHFRPSIPITPKDPCSFHRSGDLRPTLFGMQSLNYTWGALSQLGYHVPHHSDSFRNHKRVSLPNGTKWC
jgi:hypothetical protein